MFAHQINKMKLEHTKEDNERNKEANTQNIRRFLLFSVVFFFGLVSNSGGELIHTRLKFHPHLVETLIE